MKAPARKIGPEMTDMMRMTPEMTDMMRMTPDDAFPEDLEAMTDNDLQVLDSQIQRQLDHEITATGESARETEFRHEELDLEFTERGKR